MFAILTGMNIAEICGLQGKFVNLAEAWSDAGSEAIPPKTIAVRKEWYRGELGSAEQFGRKRNLPIPEPLMPILLGLSQRGNYTGHDDFVLVSGAGTPVNEKNIAARRLKPLGKALQMPSLSWHTFRRTRTTLAHELGMQSLGDRVAKDRSMV